ncbi:hypothetical protein B0H12DRAFT_1093618 [Mycena haematopus]|nr:hypothetical protein B0H12DRAFT_1093618 [Mycena haematopus]
MQIQRPGDFATMNTFLGKSCYDSDCSSTGRRVSGGPQWTISSSAFSELVHWPITICFSPRSPRGRGSTRSFAIKKRNLSASEPGAIPSSSRVKFVSFCRRCSCSRTFHSRDICSLRAGRLGIMQHPCSVCFKQLFCRLRAPAVLLASSKFKFVLDLASEYAYVPSLLRGRWSWSFACPSLPPLARLLGFGFTDWGVLRFCRGGYDEQS